MHLEENTICDDISGIIYDSIKDGDFDEEELKSIDKNIYEKYLKYKEESEVRNDV